MWASPLRMQKTKRKQKGRKQKTCLVFVHFWYRFIFGSLFSIMCASFTHIFDGVPASGAGAKQVYCDKCPKTGQRLLTCLLSCSAAHHRSMSLDVSSQICALRIRRVCAHTHTARTVYDAWATHALHLLWKWAWQVISGVNRIERAFCDGSNDQFANGVRALGLPYLYLEEIYVYIIYNICIYS